jgi:membrane peptidoglycan carboxypeptidase
VTATSGTRYGTATRHRRRPRLWLAAAAVLIATAAVAAAAWLESPAPTALGAHVAARTRGAGGKALPPGAVAPLLREAVVATEDEHFYHHHGIDLIGVLRALPYDLVHLSLAQGASTITEQVGKLLYLGGDDHNPWRKLEDAALALKLEDRYSKQEILAAYLNSAYFGAGAYGVWAASERYFGLTPHRLDTAQATLLAGLIQAPSAYDPLTHPAAARARQVEVLRALVRTGRLSSGQAASALARPLPLRNGRALPPVHGVDLAAGPAFVWWQLALGAAITSAGVLALLGSRLPRLRTRRALPLLRVLALAAVVLGAAVVVRSFRTA